MSLNDVWDSAVGNSFEPAIGKNSQLLVGSSLLFISLMLTAYFSLNRSFINLPLIGIPASLAFGFGAVYTICGVGVAALNRGLSKISIVQTMVTTDSGTNVPILNAVASSARQLFLLLRCISFSSKAQVEIRSEGLRFTVEEARTVQGLAFLDKTLFTTYSYHAPISTDQEDEDPEPVIFQISLPALLETLQIFNVDTFSSRPTYQNTGLSINRPSAFSPQSLGATSLCRLNYESIGSPLQLIMTEAGVTTTCNLSTYEPELIEEIPIQKSDLAHKIILKSSLLHDALQELSSTSPTRLSIIASPQAPFFALSASGPLGSATVEFTKDPSLLETFIVPRRTVNTYKYAMVKSAARAMALANKVSVRGDEQGVMSLQFLVEGEGANGTPTFIDFRFVPFLGEDGDEDYEEDNVDAEFV